ncbi:unnamed protein product, partial [Rhizoctonia solani]
MPDVRNLPKKKEHWGTNLPPGFPDLSDTNWYFHKDYYPSENCTRAIRTLFILFLQWFECLAQPGTGFLYAENELDGTQSANTRALSLAHGIQQILNVIGLAQLDLQARLQGVVYLRRFASVCVGMRESSITQALHGLANILCLPRWDLDLRLYSTGNQEYIGPIDYFRIDGFLVKGSYECLVRIPDLDELRALSIPTHLPLCILFEHYEELRMAVQEGLVTAIQEIYGEHIMLTVRLKPGGKGSIRFQRLLLLLHERCPNFGDNGPYDQFVFANFVPVPIESLHIPLDILSEKGRRLKEWKQQENLEILRLEAACWLNEDMEEDVADMQRLGEIISLACHRGRFVSDLFPLIKERLAIPRPVTDNSLPIGSPSVSNTTEFVAPSNYLEFNPGLAQLRLQETSDPGDSCFMIEFDGIEIQVKILSSSEELVFVGLKGKSGSTWELGFSEFRTMIHKLCAIKHCGNRGVADDGQVIIWDQFERLKCVVEITSQVLMNNPDIMMVTEPRAAAVREYHKLLVIAMAPLLVQLSELDQLAEAILYMETIWKIISDPLLCL